MGSRRAFHAFASPCLKGPFACSMVFAARHTAPQREHFVEWLDKVFSIKSVIAKEGAARLFAAPSSVAVSHDSGEVF